MTRAVVGFCVLLAVYRVGVWVGTTDARHDVPLACRPNANKPEVGRYVNLSRMP